MDQTKNASEARSSQLENGIPMGHFGMPEEIGRALRFLASEEVPFITGNGLVVDGGWSIW
jgi:3-oxoacyl-[acyl-carrier protein] reductase